MKLSILIPSIPERMPQYMALMAQLSWQMNPINEKAGQVIVQVLLNQSKKFTDGGMSIGKKRETLVKSAQGEYVCFLDDDDEIAPNYIETLLSLCDQKQHVCTFKSIAKLEGFWCVIDMRLSHKQNEQATNGIIKRTPWHVCAVRREFAVNYNFPDTNYGEDWEWFKQVLKHCHTEARSEAIIHQYNHKHESEADRAHAV